MEKRLRVRIKDNKNGFLFLLLSFFLIPRKGEARAPNYILILRRGGIARDLSFSFLRHLFVSVLSSLCRHAYYVSDCLSLFLRLHPLSSPSSPVTPTKSGLEIMLLSKGVDCPSLFIYPLSVSLRYLIDRLIRRQ